MRTRIRCPLCGNLSWESAFLKGPYQIEAKGMECKKSLGKGHGRNKFKFYNLTGVENQPFLDRIKSFLHERIEVIMQHWKYGITKSESTVINALKSKIIELENEIQWLKSSNVLTVTATPGLQLKTEDEYVNQKNPATQRNEMIISNTSSTIL